MLDLILTVSPWSGTFLSIVRVVPELSVFAGVWFSLKIQPSIKLYMYFILHLTSTFKVEFGGITELCVDGVSDCE